MLHYLTPAFNTPPIPVGNGCDWPVAAMPHQRMHTPRKELK
ncbi:hypothetical protein ABIB57_004292 [Devosia sp. UYZn731]